jgi:SPP1 family predicted phage head-tail adaptor
MAGPAEMSAARLRDRVQIQAPTETSSSTGQPVQGWETAATVWAEVTPAGGGEVVAEAQVQASPRWRVVVRRYPGLTAAHRLVTVPDGKVLQITVIDDDRRQWMVLGCEGRE